MSQRFATTHWSVVLTAADRDAPNRQEALSYLCEAYWYPLYAFARRQGHPAHEAEELVQEFFARTLERDFLNRAGPEKGRFRSFLLICLRRFLANYRESMRAQKRGGGRRIVSIDSGLAEDRFRREPAHELTAERIFERRWALTLLERVLTVLADEMSASGKEHLFETLKVYLTAGDGPPYADTAGVLEISEGAVKVAVHRLRARYRRLIRSEIAKTLNDPADVADEIRSLFSALCQ
jgi:RNA polymerase sigma factor (sigma-70 family)